MKPFEQPTMEFRQVWHEAWRQSARGDTSYWGFYTVQQKWLVQDGDPYYSPERRDEWSIKVGEWHPIQPNLGFRWVQGKPVWRELPVVQATDI